MQNLIREIDSRNVIGKIEESDAKLRNEYVVYSAHWDHFGWDLALPGAKHDQIYHGAADNASGIAALLAIAKHFKAASVPPKRTVLFIATTAEERGWLGARYYAQHPPYPLRRTLADINIDGINTWGRARDLEVIGAGKSTIDHLLARAATKQGRVVRPDHRPELGSFYRADQKIDDYIAHDHHKVTDTVKADWDLSGGGGRSGLFPPVT